MRKQTGMLKESTRYDMPSRSPKHEQVQNSRKIMKINDAIKSIMSIGNMEKMEFIAINNRNLFNYGKVKRAEWTNRKFCHQKTHFLPNLKSLKVDSTLHESIGKRGESKSVKKVQSEGGKMPEIQEALCEKYIEQFLRRLKQQKRLDVLQNRDELILQACKQIHLKMQESRVKNEKRSTKQLSSLCLTDEELWPVAKEFKGLSVNRKIKSITQASYNEEINRINRNSEYSNKQRMLNEKLFLRRIRGLKK